MRFLSIDVGIRNLAYVIFDIDDDNNATKIVDWKIVEMCEKDENACKIDNTTIGMRMRDHMKELLTQYDFDKIVIENQIGQNAIKMKSIQSMLVMFFVTENYDNTNIVNYNAANKLKHFLGKKKTTYAERKKLSKTISAEICEILYPEWSDFFNKSKKKDDLADCLLQILDFSVKHEYILNTIYDEITIVV